MQICGNVEEIIYRNEENGYTVLVVECKDDFLTCVGKTAGVNIGEDVELTGEMVKHSKFGKQFAFSTLKVVEPKSIEGIKKYLGSGLISGVGEITAERIVAKFKLDTLDIMTYSPIRLSEIKGISQKRALQIGESFARVKESQNAVIFLQQFNITLNLALKIYNIYKEKTVDVVSANPYKLVEDIDGVGFLSADKIAQNMGISPTSDFRVRAGILHILKDSSEKMGNTFLQREDLFGQVFDLLKIDDEVLLPIFDGELEKLEIENVVKIFTFHDKSCVALKSFYYMESTIASKLILLAISELEKNVDVETEIKEYERINKIELHETQKDAVRQAVKGKVTVITGGPGTGKTTIVKAILQACNNYTNKIFLLAPTGRASKRMSEACGYEASTIHRALEVTYKEGDTPRFKYNEKNKLNADVVIVDEMSMVDVSLFYSLIRALPNTCQLVLVGDKDQLPSVGAGNVLKDIIDSNVINCVKLSHIYRQDDKSLIVTNAHLINTGKMPDLSNHSTDFFYENRASGEEMFDCVIKLVTERLPAFKKCEPMDVQVLCAMKSGLCGVENLNRKLQEIINPPAFRKQEINFESRTLREGDKVMQVINNYDLEWHKTLKNGMVEKSKGVFNGDMGKIIKIDYQTGETIVAFDDDRVATYSRAEVGELFVCYATTIHKSQGSEFDIVVVPIVSGSPQIVTRNLLYTAVTRAKKMVVLVGEKKNIARMIYNNYTAKRNSMLCELIKLQHAKSEDIYG